MTTRTAPRWATDQAGRRAIVPRRRFITEMPDGTDRYIYDVAVREDMTLAEVERRLVDASALRETLIGAAGAADRLELACTWLELEGVEDALDDTVAALRRRRDELIARGGGKAA